MKFPSRRSVNRTILIVEIILVILSAVCFVVIPCDINKTAIKMDESYLESDEIEELITEYILKFVNEKRATVGREPLIYDAELSKVSKYHASDMAMNKYYSHFDLEGKSPVERAAESGYDIYTGRWYIGVGENIHSIRIKKEECDPEELARKFVEDWMGSFGHYRNIMRTFYENIGIGVSYDGVENFFAVLNFR